MNKNWNDRADKDLFFTILSVKNIGVISGSEWTTIGNHMRSLGYGFTNEGCRQHFQGLRRAQAKAENGAATDSPRRIDPTLNPITRRPGPGRGRPRKKSAAGAAAGAGGSVGSESQSPGAQQVGASPAGTVPGGPPMVQGTPAGGMPHGVPMHPQYPGVPGVSGAPPTPVSTASGAPGTPGMPTMPATQGVPMGQGPPMAQGQPMVQGQPMLAGQPQPTATMPGPGVAPQAPMTAPEQLAVDPSLDDGPEEEHAAKRQRLADSQDPSLDDEAVLNALAGHNNPTTPGEYTTEYTYGDA
ncbi:uncharacterized protein B0T15DRAFT_240516 [Chaetomium strumarium]|uniref:Myb-like domain-containing protein n=1 Tax=Chaetomium strumarium TaxID=1170767 RepID=A0AAJ0GQQ9_9PEZI|nr:hypothetical protein B0T15DRAFT_240516 [Chaetomium strumarium]